VRSGGGDRCADGKIGRGDTKRVRGVGGIYDKGKCKSGRGRVGKEGV